jgi:hypothetical protein
MIPTNKCEPKHLSIKGTSCAQKTDENSSKRHENPMSYKPGIDATMKASIHSEVRFFTNGEKSNPIEQGNEKQSGWMVCLETLELIYMSPLRARKKTTLPLALKL